MPTTDGSACANAQMKRNSKIDSNIIAGIRLA
jgi:hypothetical protein